MRFDIVWRLHGQQMGGQVLATFTNHFLRDTNNPFNAVRYDGSAQGVAAASVAGDQLILRMVVTAGDLGGNYEPDGDGPNAGGRIPRVDLPR